MVNLVKNGNNLQYMLQAADRIDNLTLGMMVNNEMEGIAALRPIQSGNDRYFKYDLEDKVTLTEYFGEYVKKEKLLNSFYRIAVAIKESTEYMLNWTSFVLDMDQIYVNPQSGQTYLICMPLLSIMNDGNTCNFFKNILFTVQFDEEENGDYVGRLITFLNPKSYTLEKFIAELENMLGLEHRQFGVYEEEEETEEEEVPVIDESESGITENTVEEAETKDSADVVSVQENPDMGDAAPAEEEALQVAVSVEEETSQDAVPTEEEVSRPVETETVQEAAENRVETENDEINNAVAEPVPTEETQEEAVEQEDDPAAKYHSFQDNSYYAVQQPAQTQAQIQGAFLLRTRTNERVAISKEKFCIGSDGENVDYYVDNKALDDIHAFIIRKGEEYFILDNNTRMGTFMNNVPLYNEEGPAFLPHDAHLRLADEEFDFKMHS